MLLLVGRIARVSRQLESIHGKLTIDRNSFAKTDSTP